MTKIKKFLLAGIITLLICSGITGCTKGEDIESAEYDRGNKYFPLVIIYKDDHSYIAYDKNKKVMYCIFQNYDKFGITPIYNADGSVELYKGGDLN
uniref:hypothetical protein n=1 Tax=Coprococcus catus TaxID=116085 RepID=UPI0022E2F764|nr:hypothetical protein [Coprococcus catus]